MGKSMLKILNSRPSITEIIAIIGNNIIVFKDKNKDVKFLDLNETGIDKKWLEFAKKNIHLAEAMGGILINDGKNDVFLDKDLVYRKSHPLNREIFLKLVSDPSIVSNKQIKLMSNLLAN